MRSGSVPWAVGLVGLVLGLMVSMQFKVQQQAALEDQTSVQRGRELASQLQKTEEDRDRLMAELEDLRARVRSMASRQVEYQELGRQLERAQVHAGLISLAGPGVTVTMNDSPRPLMPGENPNLGLIHDEDVLRVVNELIAAGAEAVAINGQRLIGRSEIRCTGPTITINGVRTAPPIVIKAIGDPGAMEAAIRARGSVADSLRQWGIQVSVKKEAEVTVPAFKGSLKLQWGTVGEAGTGAAPYGPDQAIREGAGMETSGG